MKKYWYSWFSVVALVCLFFDVEWRLSRVKKGRNKKTRDISAAADTWKAASRHVTLMFFKFVMLPSVLFMLLWELSGRMWPDLVGSYLVLPSVIQSVILFSPFYFGGVYATYRHLCWREEHVSQFL